MKIVELTETIHGEMPHAGLPCLLIRFSGCDIQCPYCDTDHSKFNEWSLDKLIEATNSTRLNSILITGGEPFIQPELEEFINRISKDKKVILETNGNALISNDRWYTWRGVTLVMDVKLFDDMKYFNPINMTKITTGDVIKFVFWDLNSFNLAINFTHSNVSKMPQHMQWVFSPTSGLIKSGKLQPFVDEVIALQKLYRLQEFYFQTQLHKILGVK